MGSIGYSKWLKASIAVALVAAISASTAMSVYFCRKKSKLLSFKVDELQRAVDSSLKKCAAERQGRIRAQKELRDALAESKSEELEKTCYPMTPIGFVQSCFSTRNGTPRQPLLVPLARACLIFNSSRVPPASLEGLSEYSHCWIIYVFHLNTDLQKLWKEPSRSKFKAKVRVPRLKGGRMGVFATRSPHRPCPIGLTVAKVEAVEGNVVLLSGVDLVDGTPILDIKPYLPYCDSIQEAAVPKWVTEDSMLTVASVSFSEGFSSSLTDCWQTAGKKSLYASPDEFQCLIKQVLSWDIRSVSQRNHPHDPPSNTVNGKAPNGSAESDCDHDERDSSHETAEVYTDNVMYHLILEGIDISYIINCNGNVVVEKAIVSTATGQNRNKSQCSYLMWRDKANSVD
ncbi:tRNA (adenine(37)-N6)-methyltransferase [Euphorbia peplus]|nr:tRNA (adenine(37)-N6)-methyltransferase [Euphorbia peplus]